MTDASATSVWDGHADAYDRQEPLERRAVEAALRLAHAGPDDHVVDLATGTGLLLRTLAESSAAPRTAVGIDRSRAMLDRVGALPQGWTTLEADARDVPLGDDVADVVTISYLLHLLTREDRAAVLGEARRLLRREGALVVVTVWTGPRPGARALGATLNRMARARPRAWGGLGTLDPTADLVRAGFVPERRVQLPRDGYPSLVIRARQAPEPSGTA